MLFAEDHKGLGVLQQDRILRWAATSTGVQQEKRICIYKGRNDRVLISNV